MSDLKRVSDLAALLTDVQNRISETNELLNQLKADERRISEEDLPQLMAEVGLSEITLESGEKVSITEQVHAGITQANNDRAVAWLVDNGFGGLVKTRLIVDYDYTERGAAVEEAQRLEGEHVTELKETVHPSTLKSFVREQLESGTLIPMDLFSVHPYSKAKISRSRR